MAQLLASAKISPALHGLVACFFLFLDTIVKLSNKMLGLLAFLAAASPPVTLEVSSGSDSTVGSTVTLSNGWTTAVFDLRCPALTALSSSHHKGKFADR